MRWDHPAGQQVGQDLAGADTGELVGVTNEEEVCVGGHRRGDRAGQLGVEHAGLIDDHGVGRQRVAATVQETSRLDAEQAVEGPRFQTNDFA
jgi:hypothetical protein